MAWIESHQELADHPKTKRMARRLKISIPCVIGHLHLFWWWAMNYAEEGDLSIFEEDDIADAARWEGDSSEFVQAMLECGPGQTSGFLEKKNGKLRVHDWYEYIGRLLDRKEQNRLRQKKHQEKLRKPVSNAASQEKQDVNNELDNAQITRDSHSYHTEPNQPNQTIPTQPNKTRAREGGEDGGMLESANTNPPAENSPEEGDGARKKQSGKGIEYTSEFEEFWSVYPRQVRKSDAFSAWNARKKEGLPVPEILKAAQTYAKAMTFLCKPPEKIMHPTTFINAERWRGWLPPDGQEYLDAKQTAKMLGKPGNGKPMSDAYDQAKATTPTEILGSVFGAGATFARGDVVDVGHVVTHAPNVLDGKGGENL